MHFEPEHSYHIFNQGNNKELIFFNRENYFFFLKKIETHIVPFADVLAYCLMPNHFHLMVYTSHQMTLSHQMTSQIATDQATLSHQMTSPQIATDQMTLSHQMTSQPSHQMSEGKQTLVQSIAIMLRSYTRAINIQESRSGSLFKPHTKAACLSNNSTITPAFSDTIHGAYINIPYPDKEYPKLCFNYIHNNPVKAGLVKDANEWEFSSYCDYYENRHNSFINFLRAKECGLI
ncbi:MAG TPA: hypothetical protein PKH58_00450 [Paludibacteraceae bacterium]|nr:hypothetical protein [Paludibacteraceae bacterium]